MPDQKFFQSCNAFITSALHERLNHIAQYYNRQGDLGLIIRIMPKDDPDSVCHIHEIGFSVVEISYSTIFAHKMLCLLKLIETHWQTYDSRKRYFVFDYDHPYDSHVWDYPRDDSYAYQANRILRPYLSLRSGLRSAPDFASFIDAVNNAKEGAFATIGFSIDETLSQQVMERVADFFGFMVLHELAHISRKHDIRLLLWPYPGLSRRSALAGKIYQHRHKAVECDADFWAFSALLGYHFETGHTSHTTLPEVLTSVALGLCLFDSDRRNTLDVKNIDGLYPIPEIRFEILCHLMEQATNVDLRGMRDRIIARCIRSFQGIGLAGPFYLFSGPLATVDDQFFKETMILSNVSDDIKKILIQLNVIFASTGGKQVDVERDILPVGMSRQQYTERMSKDLVAMFSRDPAFNDREAMERRGYQRLEYLHDEGTIREGDIFVILTNNFQELRPETKRNLTTTED